MTKQFSIHYDMSDRPVSRRGVSSVGNNSNTPSPSSILRPGTTMRGMTGRPQSTLRGGTANRFGTGMGTPTGGQRMGSTIGLFGNMLTERPITQHGLSGLPTASGRLGTASGMRQVKDKRYWMGAVQVKIQELNQEMEKLLKDTNNLDREKSAKRLYEKKVKEAAKELTILQSHHTDMNMALDSFASGLTRQNMQNETSAFREQNESLQTNLENLFKNRQQKEHENKVLENEIDMEKNKINKMIESLPKTEQNRYQDLQKLADEMKRQNGDLQNEIEHIVQKRDRLNIIVFNSQSRMEAVKLKTKLSELTTKRNALKQEEENRLTPAQEREKLINEVRSNNQALTSIGRQMKLVEDQLSDKKELLQQIDQDLDEGNSERHAKYKELRRRDETMTTFMETFQQNMEMERKQIETLKNQIAYSIEQITMQGINMKNVSGIHKTEFSERNDLNSHNGLLKEYKKLAIQLKQLQILEKRTNQQLKQLVDEENIILAEIDKFKKLDQLRDESAEEIEKLTQNLEDLMKKKTVTENVVQESERQLKEIKENLRSNDTYRQILYLEEKLTDLLKENKVLKESIDDQYAEHDYGKSKREAEQILQNFMELLNKKYN